MGFLSGLAAAVVLLATHLLAIYIAFATSGVFASVLTLALPVVSEAYWVIHLWQATGSFFNVLTGLSAGFVVLAASTYILSIAARETA
jgi:hypothetical protein